MLYVVPSSFWEIFQKNNRSERSWTTASVTVIIIAIWFVIVNVIVNQLWEVWRNMSAHEIVFFIPCLNTAKL